jgi:hypothetical protein
MYLLQVDATDEPSDQLTGSADQLTGGTDQLTGSTDGRRSKPALVYISFEDNAIRWGRVLLHFSIRYEKATVCYSKVNRWISLKNHSKGLNLWGICGKCGTQKTFLLIEKQYLRRGRTLERRRKSRIRNWEFLADPNTGLNPEPHLCKKGILLQGGNLLSVKWETSTLYTVQYRK